MKPTRSKKHQKKDAYNPSLVTVEEKEDECNEEGAEGADEETKAGENENEEAKENLDNHDLDIFFEAEVVERKDEGEEYYAKEGDYNYQEGFDEEDTFSTSMIWRVSSTTRMMRICITISRTAWSDKPNEAFSYDGVGE
jgi:hypothetical protein